MNKIPYPLLIFFSTFSILCIGWIDLNAVYTMPITIFYTIPVILLALHIKSSEIILTVNSLFAASVWVLVCIQINPVYFSLFNGLLRFAIFLIISFIIQILVKQKVRLKEQNLKLSQLNLEKNKILGFAAHDIRNGIGKIISLSTILLENQNFKNNFKEEYEFIRILHQSSGNLLELLSKILDIAKIESGNITLNLSRKEYIGFVRDRINQIRFMAQKKEIKIIADFKIDTLYFEFDPTYLQETIDNLLSNAVKYSSPKNQIEVTVYKNGKFVVTEVRDYGEGIPENEITNLFKVFSKASPQPTSGEHSSGLGLAIAKKVVELHNGTIGVESTVDHGSTFYFSLPLL